MSLEDTSVVVRVVADETGENVVAVRPIVGRGSVNRVYVAETGRVSYVVRLGTPHGAAQYRKEAWCSSRAADVGVPGPTVISVGEVEGAAYMLLYYVAGLNGDAADIDLARLWHALGEHARRIHGIAVAGFGDQLVEDEDPVRGQFSDNWERYLAYNIASLTDHDALLALGVFSLAESRLVRLVFEDLGTASLRFGLNHGDLAPRNCIVDALGQVCLLDWGSAEARVVPHHDIVQILWDSLTVSSPLFDAFLTGYGLTREDFTTLQPEIGAVALLEAIDLVRWALDRSPADIPRCVAKAQVAVRATLAGWT